MPIANCPKCQKVFQRAMNLLCPTCHQASLGQANRVCQFIERHPHRTLEEIANACEIPLKDLEALLYSGKLGALIQQIIVHCQSCNNLIAPLGTTGRFCASCTHKLENKTGVLSKTAPLDKQSRPLSAPSSPHAKPMASPSSLSFPVSEATSTKAESASSRMEPYGFKR